MMRPQIVRRRAHMTSDVSNVPTEEPKPRRQRAPSQAPAGKAPFQAGGQTIADSIYHELYRDIVSVALPPGTPISEKQLAAEKGVSRTPVREAILRLTTERLVEVVQKSGTFVARIRLSSLTEALIVRAALEGVTVRGAVDHASPSHILELRAIVEKQREIGTNIDTDAFHQADESFHAKIATIGGYDGIWALIRQVKVQVDRYRHMTLPQEGRLALIVDEHSKIVDAIESGDADQAVKSMEIHLDKLQLDIAVFRDLHPDYFIHDKEIG